MKTVVVIGGGIIGLCSAYYLRQAGHEVILLEAGKRGSSSCSTVNSGLIVPSHFVPLASPGMIGYGLRQMLSDDGPFSVIEPLSGVVLSWAARFASACLANDIEAISPVLARLHQDSLRLYFDLAATSGSFEVGTGGLCMLCRSEQEMLDLWRTGEVARKLGMDFENRNATEVRRDFPGISNDIIGAGYFPGDGWIHPEKLVAWLQTELANSVDIRYESAVAGFELNGDRLRSAKLRRNQIVGGDHFVLAAGVWSSELAHMLEISLPLLPGKGISFTMEAPKGSLKASGIDSSARLAITPMGDQIRFGGTMQIGGRLGESDADQEGRFKESVLKLFPSLDPQSVHEASVEQGLRPLSPDGLPYLGASRRISNLTIATGHAMMGVSLGPVTGKLVSELVQGSTPSHNLQFYNPNRYA